MTTTADPIEVVFSFDTTGSMYPCLTQVRREVEKSVKKLFAEIPELRIGVIAHGDYCDEPRMITKFELSSDEKAICKFVKEVEATGGGDAPEAYEAALHEARSFNWTSGRSKVLVLIGDEVPHKPDEAQNKNHLDWKNEAAMLKELGVKIYSVQALNRKHASSFYDKVAQITDGFHLTLDQFSNVTDLIFAICYHQAGPERLKAFEEEVVSSKRMNRNLDRVFSKLSGRGEATRFEPVGDLKPVPPGRFQILSVDHDSPIQDFCKEQGVEFKRGRGFYELTKTEKVQGTKEVILMDKVTGDLFTGAQVRVMLGLPIDDEDVKLHAAHLDKYAVFVQSTSNNRKLIGKTRMLYEVPDWDSSGTAAAA